MRANSSLVKSNQSSVHEQLAAIVAKHARTQFLKPITPYNRTAFDISIAAWRDAGALPLILDAGCGVGLSTLHLASQFPDHFVIGVDQSADRLGRNTLWPSALPNNFMRVRADLVDYWRLLHDAGIRLTRHYLLYPNPWPKPSHMTRRWHGHAVFPTIVALGGHLECRSNWQIYIEECASALRQLAHSEITVEQYLPRKPASNVRMDRSASPIQDAITPFEKKYLVSGHMLWRCLTHLE
ncbi:MAG TPA: SAM-dependent methyltransferase [Burkholderiaceae bacterium]|jgi:tRNA G46 methylase TrmB